MLAGALAGGTTGVLHTRFQINGLLAGILVATGGLLGQSARDGRSNVPLLDARTVSTDSDVRRSAGVGPCRDVPVLGREVRFRDAVNLGAVGFWWPRSARGCSGRSCGRASGRRCGPPATIPG